MSKSDNGIHNILVVGVGGQGVILASEILADVAMTSGRDVKKSEVHGMAQRGGVVSSHVRYGALVHSPLIPKGEVSVLLSFELDETLRWLDFLSPYGRVIANLQQVIPPMVSSGLAQYPQDAGDVLRSSTREPVLVDALGMADQLGNLRLVNTILLGITSRMLDLPMRNWRRVVAARVPSAFKELNLKAFEMGSSLV
jgi:indolepyruvate ferredoxin oxidoreductase, beta subunit